MAQHPAASRDFAAGPSDSTTNAVALPGSKIPEPLVRAILELPAKAKRCLVAFELVDRTTIPVKEVEMLQGVAQDLRSLWNHLDALQQPEADTAVTSLLRLDEGSVAAALQQLVAVALRLPPVATQAGSSGSNLDNYSWRCALIDVGFWACTVVGLVMYADAATKFVRALIRIDTLQACAAQMARLLAAANTTTGGLQQGLQHLRIVFFLLISFCRHKKILSQSAGGDSASHLPSCLEELAAALRSSRVLEHASRLLVWLLQATAGNGEYEELRHELADAATRAFHALCLGVLLPPSLPVSVQLVEAASGPSADFTVMSIGLAALCAADGGPSYGLPEEVQEACPVLTVPGTSADASEVSALCLTALVEATQMSARAGRLGRRAAATLLLRVCRLGVASLQVHQAAAASAAGQGECTGAAAGGGQSDEAGGDDASGGMLLRMRLPRCDCICLAASCLTAARALLVTRRAKWQAMAAEWWGLVVRLCSAAADEVGAADSQLPRVWLVQLGALVSQPLVGADSSTRRPDPAPSDVAAALAAGLLPCLERLIRRSGEEPQGPASLIFRGIQSRLEFGWSCIRTWEALLGLLLGYGDPLQAAALRATASLVLGVEMGGAGDGGGGGGAVMGHGGEACSVTFSVGCGADDLPLSRRRHGRMRR